MTAARDAFRDGPRGTMTCAAAYLRVSTWDQTVATQRPETKPLPCFLTVRTMTDEGAEGAATETPSQEPRSRKATTRLSKDVFASADEYDRLIGPLIYAMLETDRFEGRRELFNRAHEALTELFGRLRKAAGTPLDGLIEFDTSTEGCK